MGERLRFKLPFSHPPQRQWTRLASRPWSMCWKAQVIYSMWPTSTFILTSTCRLGFYFLSCQLGRQLQLLATLCTLQDHTARFVFIDIRQRTAYIRMQLLRLSLSLTQWRFTEEWYWGQKLLSCHKSHNFQQHKILFPNRFWQLFWIDLKDSTNNLNSRMNKRRKLFWMQLFRSKSAIGPAANSCCTDLNQFLITQEFCLQTSDYKTPIRSLVKFFLLNYNV